MNAPICPYCNKPAKLAESTEVYRKDFGKIWICRPCMAYVGCHRGTEMPLGTLANEELRALRIDAHFWFDKIAKGRLINDVWPEYIPNTKNRKKAYLWLSKQLKIAVEQTHIGMFDEAMCKKVIWICRNTIKDIKPDTMKSDIHESH